MKAKWTRLAALAAVAIVAAGSALGAKSEKYTARLGWVPIAGAERANVTGKGSATATLAGPKLPQLTSAISNAGIRSSVRDEFDALKAETKWFHDEARRMFELLSLPVLQLLAVALNFAVVTVQSRPMFVLPFRTMDDMMAAVPGQTAREPKLERTWNPGVRTPRDPMTAVAS